MYICYKSCQELFEKHENNYMLEYSKFDNSNEEQDSKMLYWLFRAPCSIQIHRENVTFCK